MNIEFEGMDKVIAGLELNGAEIERALQKCCLYVETSAKRNAPKDTGSLARSIESRVIEEDGKLIGEVFTNESYAPYIEYGTGLFAENGDGRKEVPWNYQDDSGAWHSTSGMAPQPYMRPALNENRTKILEKLKGALKQ